MLFFNKTEQGYLDDFIANHKKLKSTYFAPYQSPGEFFKRVQSDANKYGCFFVQGFFDLVNSACSLCKSLCLLGTFSFEAAQSALVDSAGYFASGMIKHGFLLLSLCLDSVQQLSKLVSSLFFASGLSAACAWRQPNNTSSESKQRIYDEIDSIYCALEELAIAKRDVEEGLNYRLDKLNQWKMQQQSSSPVLFKPTQMHQVVMTNEQLDDLMKRLMLCLDSYPQFNSAEAKQLSYYTEYHRQYEAHHEIFVTIAIECFNVFDDYLSYLENPNKESTNLLSL